MLEYMYVVHVLWLYVRVYMDVCIGMCVFI
jgi:hypothetical protein